MRIIVHTPLGKFASEETEAVTYDEAVRQAKSFDGGISMKDPEGALIMFPNTMIPHCVIVVEGCLPNPAPAAKPVVVEVE